MYNTLFIVNNHIMNHTKHTCTILVFPSTIQNIIHFSNGSREKKNRPKAGMTYPKFHVVDKQK